MVEKKTDLVQRFVDASIVGWYNYIYGDNSAGNAMIKKLNPEMTDELLAYSVAKMKQYGIVNSGESLKNGIGAMSDERYTSFFDKMVKAGVVQARSRLPQVLHVALRQQGRRRRAAPEQAVTPFTSRAALDVSRQNLGRGRSRPDGPRRQPARRDQGLRQWRHGARPARSRRAQGRVHFAARPFRLRQVDRAAADRGARCTVVRHVAGRASRGAQPAKFNQVTVSASCSRSRP